MIIKCKVFYDRVCVVRYGKRNETMSGICTTFGQLTIQNICPTYYTIICTTYYSNICPLYNKEYLYNLQYKTFIQITI